MTLDGALHRSHNALSIDPPSNVAAPTSQRIALPDNVPTDIPGEGIVAHWYRPTIVHAERNQRGVVCLPIQGGDYEVSTLLAEFLAKRGYHTLRFERRAEWLDHEVALPVLAQLVPHFVADIRRTVDHWLGLPDAPTAPTLGLLGVSMGAMTGTLLAASDPRFAAVVLCIGGGELSDILVDGRDTELDAWRVHMVEKLGGAEEFANEVRTHVRQIGVLDAGAQLDAKRTLFVAARFDRVVPWSASKRLWNAIGQPKRITLPTGHYSAAIGLPLIKSAATRWFDKHLIQEPT